VGWPRNKWQQKTFILNLFNDPIVGAAGAEAVRGVGGDRGRDKADGRVQQAALPQELVLQHPGANLTAP
jgi:hypothetical protein